MEKQEKLAILCAKIRELYPDEAVLISIVDQGNEQMQILSNVRPEQIADLIKTTYQVHTQRTPEQTFIDNPTTEAQA